MHRRTLFWNIWNAQKRDTTGIIQYMCWIFDGRVVKHMDSEVCLHTCSLTLSKMAHWIDESAINFFCSSVCRGLGVWDISFRFLARTREFLFSTTPSLPSNGYRGSFPWGGGGWGVKLTTYLRHIFMVGCSSKHRRNFLSTLQMVVCG